MLNFIKKTYEWKSKYQEGVEQYKNQLNKLWFPNF